MVNKTLLYKYEYKNVEENTIPKFKPEDIGYILHTIEKGISSSISLFFRVVTII